MARLDLFMYLFLFSTEWRNITADVKYKFHVDSFNWEMYAVASLLLSLISKQNKSVFDTTQKNTTSEFKVLSEMGLTASLTP